MRDQHVRTPFEKLRKLLVALSLLAFAGCVGAEDLRAEGRNIRADRSRLTFRDSGLYCNFKLEHGVKPKDGTNMLPAQRAATDAPWTFQILQYNPVGPEFRPHKDEVAFIRQMAKNGKKAIVRVLFKVGGKIDVALDIARAQKIISNLLDEIKPEWLYAITLDEENVYWNGNAATLAELYKWTKSRWPDLPVYQWWTPMIAPDVRAKSGWVALPADGWIMDLYGLHREEFEKKTVRFLETGKPLVHIAWASPTWIFHDRQGSTKEDWWDKKGRRVLDEQLDVCQAYDVPVAYFCTQPAEWKNGKRVPILWGWHATDPAVRKEYRRLEAMVMNFRRLPAESMGYRSLDARKFAWAHGGAAPVGLSYDLDDKSRKRVHWPPRLGNVPQEPGEHPVPASADNVYFKATCILDESASQLRPKFGVPSMKGKSVRVPVVFRIEPLRPLAGMRVSADVVVIKDLGGSAQLAFSTDGKNWSHAASTVPDKKKKNQMLTASAPGEGFGEKPFWVRVTLIANAGADTNVASRLSGLRVSAAFEPKLTGR